MAGSVPEPPGVGPRGAVRYSRGFPLPVTFVQPAPAVKDLVLVGGGHAHLTVLKRFGMRPLPGVRLTLVTRTSQSPYSGMLPGLVAGHYAADDMHFDMRTLADFAGARFIHAEVTGLDPGARRILCRDRAPIEYDVLSLNTGSVPAQAALAAQAAWATPVKPIDAFHARWLALKTRALAATGPFAIGVVGGGAGGVELLLAVRHRLRTELAAAGRDAGHLAFHLVAASTELLPSHNARVRARFAQLFARQGIRVHLGERIVDFAEDAMVSATGRRFRFDEMLWVTQAAPAPWFAEAGLAVDADGCVRVDTALRSVSHPEIFAAGDCATIDGAVRPKSGVYAVRQGPFLADNLRRALAGEALRGYRPQRDALALISTGPRHAIASRGRWALGGDWVWRWKDFIDRRFMRKFQVLPARAMTPTAAPPAALAPALAELGPVDMRCGGCGAKVGAEVIADALCEVASEPRADVVLGLAGRDDAAVIEVPPGRLAVHTIDGFRAFVSDPYLFGQVTAAHCLSDLYAMGAEPQSALAYVTLPLCAPALMRRDLVQLLAGARDVFDRDGIALVGGHTSEGAELALAFAANGHIERGAIRAKGGARRGDALVLTKPLGAGVLFAAAMQRRAHPAWIDAALPLLVATNAIAARVAQQFDVHAMTDITGFGLAGHLAEMLQRNGARAELVLARLPLLAGAEALAAAGVRSTLHRANARLDASISVRDADYDAARLSLLFDPQTSGGLLVALAGQEAEQYVETLHAEGITHAAIVGFVT